VPRGASYPTEHAPLPYLQRYTRTEAFGKVTLSEQEVFTRYWTTWEVKRDPYGDVVAYAGKMGHSDNVQKMSLSYPCSPHVGTARHGSKSDVLCHYT
jgi:hypothetical protein